MLKMLPRSMTSPYKKMLTPSFMMLEHIPVMMMNQFFEEEEEAAPLETARSDVISAQEAPQKYHKAEVDRDRNVFIISTESISEETVEFKQTLADTLIKAYHDYEDFVGSSYYKHLRLYKYYQMLINALQNTQ